VSWDETLFRAVNGLAGRSDILDWLARSLSSPDLLWGPAVILGAYWLWLSRREMVIAAPLLGGVIGIADFLGARIKGLVARPRPCVALPDIHQIEACGKAFGFPSNHAINTAAAAAFLHVLYPKSGWISWPLVAMIGVTRVFIGAHYVTDVLGGWLLGGLFGAAAAWTLLQWPRFRRRPLPSAPSTGIAQKP